MDVTNREVIERAIAAFSEGVPILIHDFDDRENETDLVVAASKITPELISMFRNEAGGLVCVAISDGVAEALNLPFLSDMIDHQLTESGDLKYDTRSAFSLPVNHRDTYTGITDIDRSITIKRIAEVSSDVERGEYNAEQFAKEFRSPGHVQILRSAPSLEERKGHTELGIAIAKAANMEPAVVVCEMLDDINGKASSKENMKKYAKINGLLFIEGKVLVEELEGKM
tara:strand:- start:507 stop:1187 length:681 start_codon:yes stop_codon:yes gene_type:complete